MSCGAFTEIQFVLNELIPNELDGKQILDVGCGYGFWGWALRAFRKGTPLIFGIDVNEERLKKTKEIGMYDLLINEDVTKWCPVHKFDLIMVSHIIEHLSKVDGLKLLRKLKKFSQGTIIVTCPEGDTRASLDGGDAPHDEHISIWVEDDLHRLGFNTLHMRFSHRAGRMVSFFEKIWFKIKGLKRGGVIIGWLSACAPDNDITAEISKV